MDNGQQLTDRVTQVIVEALKEAAGATGEQRLFRSGKLPGLLPGRTGLNAEAAERALREGLVERVRTETRGKTNIEWVRLTAKGVEFIHTHESPARALDELRVVLQATQEGMPGWLADLRRQVEEMARRLEDEVQGIARRLQHLTERVDEAMRRAELTVLRLTEEAKAILPWGQDAIQFLERRREGGLLNSCPLPELFETLQEKHPDLSLKAFQDGLVWLHDRTSVLRLLPFEGPFDDLPRPEFAIPHGARVCYHVARTW